MNRKFSFLAVAMILGVVALPACARLDDQAYAKVEAAQPQIGDVVFTKIGGPLFARVADTTLSWTSHVGIIVAQKDGDLVVAESGVPRVRMTPLREFLGHSSGQQFAIMRLNQAPTEAQKAEMLKFANSQMGKFYHLGFDLSSNRTFCSKFVHDVVATSTNQQLGEVETFDHLLHRNPHSPLWFWRTWFLGRIPWSRTTITPASELVSPLLHSVITNNLSS